MAKRNRTPKRPKKTAPRDKAPAANPASAADRIDRFLNEVPALFHLAYAAQREQGAYYLPESSPSSERERIAKKEDLKWVTDPKKKELIRREYAAICKRCADRGRRLVAEHGRLSQEARAVAGLLVDAVLEPKAVLLFARILEQSRTTVDLMDFWLADAEAAFRAACLALEEAKLHFEAKARAAEPQSDKLDYNTTLETFMEYFCAPLRPELVKRWAKQLRDAHKNKTCLLPPYVGKPKKGQRHAYKAAELMKAWPRLREHIPELPPLKQFTSKTISTVK